MGCGCGKGSAAAAARAGRRAPAGYRVTLPNGETTDVLTALEAKRMIRRAGGGTVRVLSAEQAGAGQAAEKASAG